MENFEITSDFIRGHIDTIILKAILSGDKHAQEISNYIEEKSNGKFEFIQQIDIDEPICVICGEE